MTSLWHTMSEVYRDAMDNKSDPRVRDWFMMSGPLPTLITCIFYVYFVKVLGPKLMENRKPFVLRRVMIYYNAFQVIVSIFLFYGALVCGWWNDYSFRCQPVDFSNNPKALSAASLCWWYYISKITELLDTVFFVLRKKYDHISILHVYHHGMMPISSWLGVKFVPGGNTTFMGLLNTFVHIIMYGYYLLAAGGPKVQRYLWWKKYLTSLQLIQFVLITLHSLQLLFVECDYPKIFAYWIGVNAILFFYLFRRFYIRSYVKNNSKPISAAASHHQKKH